ncbi:MAG: hypothetical protein LQ345_002247 [Seirophora villosa]|nr:MAG: hypothetical protein LQ345_002247 [Seirophora villosa]
MAASNGLVSIYSATYSNVPVYEFNIGGNHVMRRRQDDWINATHILKVADYDKPARTRILEREVQKGTHEKIQGGYGKFQGTWVPLHEGRLLAERNGVLGKLRPLFDFVPGTISPPQAPKHQTAASNKGPRIPKPPQIKKNMPPPSQMSEDPYEAINPQLNDDESMAASEIGSESFMGEEELVYGSRKRKRGPDTSYVEQQHTFYADSLLDYFMLSESDRPYRLDPPPPPDGFMVNHPIDDQGHTALHWGAAMGDIDTIRMFINRGARINATNKRGETPLIRSVIFTNNHEKQTMSRLVDILQDTLTARDHFGATVLHHVAMTTKSSSRKKSARHYLEVLLTKLADILTPQQFSQFLDARDGNGDTAVHIVVRHSARKCLRVLLGRGVNVDILNSNNETASEMMQRSGSYRVDNDFAIASSSPVQPAAAGPMVNGHSSRSSKTQSFPANNSSSQSFSASFGPMINDKALQLNLAMEDELQSMDASYADAVKINEKTTHERNQVRQRTFELSMEDQADSDEVRRLQEESVALAAANASLLEQEQHQILHREVGTRERTIPPEDLVSADPAVEDQSRLQAAHALAEEQTRRRELTREVVAAQALAGMTERGEAYKRLVAASMGVPVQEVPTLMPDVWSELEAGKMDEAAAAATATTIGVEGKNKKMRVGVVAA